MDYLELIAFGIAIPLGYFIEFVVAWVYVSWTACRRNALLSPFNAAFTTSLVLALAVLVYLRPTLIVLSGLLVGASYRFGWDYGEMFQRLGELKQECLYEKHKHNKQLTQCFNECITKYGGG